MKKAVFLDRDGVINEVLTHRVKFVNRPEDLYLLPGVAEAIAKIRELGYSIFVVTNQGGVGLGYMKESMLKKVHKKMVELLLNEHPKAVIDEILYCPHRPDALCACRKPEPGMIIQLAKKHRIHLADSWMVGDREVDLIAGQRAGCKSVLITSDFTLLDFANQLMAEK